MKLFFNRPSPYARKVLVVAHEKGLIDRLDLCETDPWTDPDELIAATPLGKVPALITDDGVLITESGAISAYLDELGGGSRLGADGDARTAARGGLAQGLTDAAFAIVIERRRPEPQRWPQWIERQRRAIARTLAKVEPGPSGRFDLGDIALACALAYLDFRLAETGWRRAHPTLAHWLDAVSERPSMRATAP